MKQVGRYQIVEELGRGAIGVVYKALDPAIGRTVAIKTIRLTIFAEGVERQRIREQLLHEAQSAGLLSHPNIVTIYDVLEEDEAAYIFMEYVHGSSLDRMLRGQFLPERTALLHFLKQVSDALDYAHRKGIIHRDIKPANILISEAGTKLERSAKISDFGIAKFISQEMTQGGTIIGTPSYMSPEQIQGTAVDARSDQFSLAVVVYELLSGARPFVADNVPALLYLICKQDPLPIQHLKSGRSDEVGKVLQRALSKNAEERFPSCGDFIGALATALEAPPEQAIIAPGTAGARGTLDGAAVGKSVAWVPAAAPAISKDASLRQSQVHDNETSRPLPYELPTIHRRHRSQKDDDQDEVPQRSSLWAKLGLLLALCLVIAGAAVFFKRWMPASNVPVQVVDIKSGPVTPPPSETEPAKTQATKQEQDNTEAARIDAPKQNLENPETAPSQPPNQKRDTEAAPREPVKRKQDTGAARTQPANQRRRANSKTSLPTRPDRQIAADEPSGPGVADIELLTDPPGAKIVVDNRLRDACTSPCTLSLQNGRHTMLAQLNGYTDARRIFTVPDDDSVFVTLAKSMGVLIVTSSPPGASIFVDGKNYGHTPATLHLPAGVHILALVNGPLRHQETVEVQNDGLAERNFRFSEQ